VKRPESRISLSRNSSVQKSPRFLKGFYMERVREGRTPDLMLAKRRARKTLLHPIKGLLKFLASLYV
jgi:hypothetical protein